MPGSRNIALLSSFQHGLTLRKLATAPVRLREALFSRANETPDHKHISPRLLASPTGILNFMFTANSWREQCVALLAIRPFDWHCQASLRLERDTTHL